MTIGGRELGSRYDAGVVAEKLKRRDNHEVGQRDLTKRRRKDVWGFEASKPSFSDIPLTMTTPNPTLPSAAAQAFKYMNVWGAFSFKLPQKLKQHRTGEITQWLRALALEMTQVQLSTPKYQLTTMYSSSSGVSGILF